MVLKAPMIMTDSGTSISTNLSRLLQYVVREDSRCRREIRMLSGGPCTDRDLLESRFCRVASSLFSIKSALH